jgi:phosphoribosylformylglycinamidine synthase
LPPRAEVRSATLTWNDSGKFEDRWVRMQVVSNQCVFLQGIEGLELPVAHAEGKFVPRNSQILEQLERDAQVVLRYSGNGAGPVAYPDNPNGSVGDVAGICDTTGRVFGLMPHPERFIDPIQHPQWTRKLRISEGDGLAIFRNAVNYFG